VRGGSGGPVGGIGEVGAGEDGSVASAVDNGSLMGRTCGGAEAGEERIRGEGRFWSTRTGLW